MYNVSQMSEQSYWANGLLCCQKLVLRFKAASYMFYVSLGTLYRYQGCIKYSLCCLGNAIHVPQHKTPFARYNCEPLCSSNFGDSKMCRFWIYLAYIGPQSVPTPTRIKFRTVLNVPGTTKVQLSEWTTIVAQTLRIPRAFKMCGFWFCLADTNILALSKSPHQKESNSQILWIPQELHEVSSVGEQLVWLRKIEIENALRTRAFEIKTFCLT